MFAQRAHQEHSTAECGAANDGFALYYPESTQCIASLEAIYVFSTPSVAQARRNGDRDLPTAAPLSPQQGYLVGWLVANTESSVLVL
jgi:hypothetical protein